MSTSTFTFTFTSGPTTPVGAWRPRATRVRGVIEVESELVARSTAVLPTSGRWIGDPRSVFSMASLRQRLAQGILIDGQYELEHQLGAGGMGTVWAAHDTRLGRSVAIKFLNSDFFHSNEAHARFKREARMVGKIRSAHVVQAFAQGTTDDGVPFVVMELLDGEDLEAYLERVGTCGLTLTGHILEQVCKGLGRAHHDGFIHRDIKPHNIFLVAEGGSDVFVKLLDFGIAKDVGMQATALTLTGAVMGSLLYMSPEQLVDSHSVGPSTDIWSLGVVTYQMLTGSLPFVCKSLPELIYSVTAGRFERASVVNGALPQQLDAFFERALCPNRHERYATVEELGEAFACIARTHASGVTAKPKPRLPPVAAPASPRAAKPAAKQVGHAGANESSDGGGPDAIGARPGPPVLPPQERPRPTGQSMDRPKHAFHSDAGPSREYPTRLRARWIGIIASVLVLLGLAALWLRTPSGREDEAVMRPRPTQSSQRPGLEPAKAIEVGARDLPAPQPARSAAPASGRQEPASASTQSDMSAAVKAPSDDRPAPRDEDRSQKQAGQQTEQRAAPAKLKAPGALGNTEGTGAQAHPRPEAKTTRVVPRDYGF